MKKVWGAILVVASLAGVTGCNNELSIPAYVPAVPNAAREVLGHDYQNGSADYWAARPAAGREVAAPEVVGILPKNIQNLLCNSVHHAEMGHLDQAYQKLDLAKNDKLVKLLDKGDITNEQYIELDQWMADLIELLYENMEGYPAVERSFPFSCAGQDETSEAVGEVIELDVEENSEPADKFIEQVCFSTFAVEGRNYLDAADHLIHAEIMGIDMLLDRDLDSAYRSTLKGWMRTLNTLILTRPTQYLSLQDTFQCERYRASHTH